MNKTKESNTTMHQKYAYIRISDSSQKIYRQVDFMKQFGIDDNNIYIDKQSGKDFNRPSYKRLVKKLKSGDTLYVKELDRLGRNKSEIKEELNRMQKKQVHIRIANIPTTMHDFGEDDWILDMVNNILIEVLAAVAEQERLTNHQRQAEGIAAAKSRGVKFGRPVCCLPDNFEYYYTAWNTKQMSVSEIISHLNIDKTKWKTWVRSYRQHLTSNQDC